MITRSKSGVFKPKVLMTAVEPNSVEEALGNDHWKAAMTEEYLAFMRNKLGL